MRRKLLVLLAMAALPLFSGGPEGPPLRLLHAQGTAPTLPERGASDITAYLQGVVASGDIPAMVALVVNRDRIIYHHAFGKQNAAKNVPASTDTIFNIASMTKPITSAATMMLVQEGTIRLDDEAAKYLPALANVQVLADVDTRADSYQTRKPRRAITVRHLLTNTSGIGYSWSDPGLALVQRKTNAADPDLPLVHDPGERWTYGGSTRVLGEIIAKVAGQPLDRHYSERIFGPLGMRDTAWEVPPAKRSRLVSIHNRTDGRWLESTDPLPPAVVRGDGGLYSTAADYAQFIRLFLNNGALNGTRLLTEQTIREMTRNQIGSLVVPLQPSSNPARANPFPLGAGKDQWGFGFQLAATGGPAARSVGSYAWAGIYNTEFWIDPQKQIGAILLMQVLPFYDSKAIDVLRGFEQRIYRHLVLSSAPLKS